MSHLQETAVGRPTTHQPQNKVRCACVFGHKQCTLDYLMHGSHYLLHVSLQLYPTLFTACVPTALPCRVLSLVVVSGLLIVSDSLVSNIKKRTRLQAYLWYHKPHNYSVCRVIVVRLVNRDVTVLCVHISLAI